MRPHRSCLVWLMAIGLLLVSAGCSPDVGGVDGRRSHSPEFMELIKPQADFVEVVDRLDKGECRRALPLLTIYLAQGDETEVADYLLGRAYLCAGDYVKGAHHLSKAWTAAPPAALKPEIRGAAREGADSLVAQASARGGLAFAELKAAYLLYAFGDESWYSSEASALLASFAERLALRGDYLRILRVVKVMKRIGAGLEETFLVEAPTLVRLGELERLREVVASARAKLPDPVGEILFKVGLLAEEAFRHEAAAWLYQQCIEAGCGRDDAHLDLARAYLKAENFEAAGSAYAQYLAGTQGPPMADRIFRVADLLRQYDRFDEAIQVLSDGRKSNAAKFGFSRRLAALQKKVPDKVDAATIFGEYLVAAGYGDEAVSNVGDTCIEWKSADIGQSLMQAASGKGAEVGLVSFYQGAFHWFKGESAKAEKAFERAVAKAADSSAMLDRVAAFLAARGHSKEARVYLKKALNRVEDGTEILLKLGMLMEEEKVGSGVVFVEKKLKHLPRTGAAYAALAAWCDDRGYPKRAVKYAKLAVQYAKGKDVTTAHLELGRLQLKNLDFPAAIATLGKMVPDTGSSVEAVRGIFGYLDGVSNSEYSCFVHEVAQRLLNAGELPDDLLRPAAAAGIQCGIPDAALAARLVDTSKDPAAELMFLVELAHDSASRAVVVAVEAGRDFTFDDPKLAALLAELFATVSMSAKALEYASRYASTTTAQVGSMVKLARLVLFKGSADAARVILRAAWEKTPRGHGGDFGLLLASLLVSNGEDEAGMRVVRRLTRIPGRRSRFSAGGAVLFIDARKPDLAQQLCVDALRNPEEGGGAPTSIDLEDDSGGPGGMIKPTLRTLVASQEPSTMEDARGTLVALLAYSWKMQDKPWTDLVDELLPLVEPWHGEHLVAATIQKLGGQEQALELFAQAFGKAPARLDLMKRYVDALVYANYLKRGKSGDVSDQVLAIADRFVKARERDAEAYRLAATYLDKKGLFSLSARLFGTLAQDSNMDADLALAYAKALVSAGKFEEAEGNFRLAAQLGACAVETINASAQVLERVGRRAFALKLAKECVVRYPRDASLHLISARLLLGQRGDAAAVDAVAGLKKAIGLDDSLLKDAAELLYANNLYGDAMAFATLMVKSDDARTVRAGVELGFKLASLTGDFEAMARLGSQATRNQRDNQFISEIAGLYFKFNLMPQGVEKLRGALGGSEPYVPLLLGIRLISMGQKKEGLKLLRDYFEKEIPEGKAAPGKMPDDKFDSLKIQLDFLLDGELIEDADWLLMRAVKLYPEDPRLRIRLMKVALDAADLAGFLEHLRALEDRWLSGDARQEVLALFNRVREKGALGVVEVLTEQCKGLERASCRPLLFYALALSGDDKALAAEADKSASAAGLDAVNLYDLGTLLLDAGRPQVAEVLLVEAIARAWGANSLLAEAHLALCRLYAATGRGDKMAHVTKMVLLHTESDMELRKDLPQNLVKYEYLEEGEEQLRLLELLEDRSPQIALERFELLLKKGDFQGAREFAFRTSFQSEGVLNLLMTFASLARRKLAFELGHELYSAALELDPTNKALSFLVAELALVQDRPEEALTQFSTYRGDGSGALARTREVIQNLGKYNYLAAALKLAAESRDPEAMLLVGLNYLRGGRPDEGGRMVLDALADSGDKAPQRARSVLLAALTQPQMLPAKVVKGARKLGCAGKTQASICRCWRGMELLRGGDLKGADSVFASQLRGSDETWLFTLASFRAYLRHGNADAARNQLARTMLGFNRAQVLGEALRTIFALLEEGALSTEAVSAAATLAREYTTELLQDNPYDFWFRTQRAEIELLADNGAAARDLYEGFLEQTPWEPGLYNNLAYLLSKLNVELDRGMKLVREALRREPSHSTFYLDTEGWLLYRQGKLAEAEGKVRGAIWRAHLGFGSSLAESLYHLALLRHEQGDNQEAVRLYRVGSFMDPHGEYGRRCRAGLDKLGNDPYGLK